MNLTPNFTLRELRGEAAPPKVRQNLQKTANRLQAFRGILQTLDGGAPVSPFTVSRELGHGSRQIVEDVYFHLGTIRHRTEAVEYRIEQHEATLRDRLAALALTVTATVTDGINASQQP